jgi:hypothetical protein
VNRRVVPFNGDQALDWQPPHQMMTIRMYDEGVKKQLLSDQDALRKVESRRFEILDSPWDFVVDAVDLDARLANDTN